ncbi:hypothetical protein, partial [Hydrogenoanaerobacterium sp.]|uniref:hypothetical protein n=1 Tax=Hydrogenoanaerobacterium sp. TaxID=2953763 RepID=UPI0028980690
MQFDTYDLPKMLHYALRLPVALYQGKLLLQNFPSKISSVVGLLQNGDPLDGLAYGKGQPYTAQYLSN